MATLLFEKAPGLTINRSKSTLTPINVMDRANQVAAKWNVPCQPLPIKYLGAPLAKKPLSK